MLGKSRTGFHSVTPRIVAADAAAEVAFLRAAFGATGELHDDRPAEMRIGDSLVMVSHAGERDSFPAFLYLYVDNADATLRRALAAGAVLLEEPRDTPYGDRRAMVRDPSGSVWQIAHVARAPVAVRPASEDEVDALTMIWAEGWRDAHLDIVPADLARLRTLESFRERMAAGLSEVRVVGPPGAPLGFSMLKGDELYQLYVASEARGSGVAAALMADAEARLAERGVEVAWLACAIGNDRAARFYEKCGWRRVGTWTDPLETSTGTFFLDVWRYEKQVGPGRRT